MSYLRNHEVTFEPIEQWPGELTYDRRPSPFRAGWPTTLEKLDHELWELRAARVVMQVKLDRSRIRLDGAPRSGARIPPPVVLSFGSKHGPQMFPCDTFDDWKDNVRAIALALEALRKVDRYGVSKRGEQYRGWQSLPAPAADGFSSRESAWLFLKRLLKWEGPAPDHQSLVDLLREADRKTHPDAGGDPELFKQVQRAREKLLA